MNKIYFIILLLIGGCNNQKSPSWPVCDEKLHPKPADYKLFVNDLGDVTMPDGEICPLREVNQFGECNVAWCLSTVYDQHNYCKYQISSYQTLARRLICRSGTKFLLKEDFIRDLDFIH